MGFILLASSSWTLYGNALGSANFDFEITGRPAPPAVTILPRVYNAADVEQPGSSGLIQGQYVGLDVSTTSALSLILTDFHTDDSEGGYLVIERREYARPTGVVDERPKIISPKIRPTGVSGNHPIFPTFPQKPHRTYTRV